VKALLFYVLHAAALATGLLTVVRLARAGRLTGIPRWPYLLGVLGLSGLMFAISEPQDDVWQDFIDAYYAAGAAALGGSAKVVALLEHGVHGFVNLPVVAYFFAPFGLLRPRPAGALFMLLGLAATAWTWRLLVRAARLPAREAAILALLIVLNGPLWNSLREGNTTHFTLLAVTAALLCLRDGRDFAGGALLGAAALLKLPLLLFGPYLVLRRRWRAAAGGALVIGLVAAASLLVFGADVHAFWYRTFVAGSGAKPIAAFNVQSVAGFMARLERGVPSLWDWTGQPLGAASGLVVKAITALTLLAAFASALVPRRTSSARPLTEEERDVELLLVLVLACVSSPLSWSHYYAWMLLPVAFLLAPGSPVAATERTRRLGYLAIALVSLPVVWPPDALGAHPTAGRLYALGNSHLLAGAFLILALVVLARAHLRRGGPVSN
jgi:alpha-1,2-mannosyltransferase